MAKGDRPGGQVGTSVMCFRPWWWGGAYSEAIGRAVAAAISWASVLRITVDVDEGITVEWVAGVAGRYVTENGMRNILDGVVPKKGA